MTTNQNSGGGTAQARATILLIDDDIELCELMQRFFTRRGMDLEVVHDGHRGLARALGGGHDLLLLDVMMPGLDGFELLRQLRRQSQALFPGRGRPQPGQRRGGPWAGHRPPRRGSTPGQDRGAQRPAGLGDHDLAAARTSPDQGPARRDLSAGLSVVRQEFQADEGDGERRPLKTGGFRACGFCTARGPPRLPSSSGRPCRSGTR